MIPILMRDVKCGSNVYNMIKKMYNIYTFFYIQI